MKLQGQMQSKDATKASSLDKPRSVSLKLELEALKSRNEAVVNNLQAQIKRIAAKNRKARQRATSVVQESTDKRSEIYTTLRANKMLRDKVLQMKKTTTKMLIQVEQAQVLMAAMHDQLERYQNVVDGQTLEITQLHAKVKQLEKLKLSLEGKFLEIVEKESIEHPFVSDTKAGLKLEKAVRIAGLRQLRRKLMQRDQQKQRTFCHKGNKVVNDEKEKDAVRGCASTAVADLEKQFEMLQKSRIQDNSTIFELGLQLGCDLKSLVQHLDIDAVIKSAIQAIVQNQTAKLECVGQNKPPHERHVKKQLVQGLQIQQDFEEKQLVEADKSNTKRGQQAGLKEVRKDQKQLGAQLGQEKQMYVELRQGLNEQMEAAGKLHLAKGDGNNIALVVVEAIEDQLAKLQAQMASLLTPLPPDSLVKVNVRDASFFTHKAPIHNNDEGDTKVVPSVKPVSLLSRTAVDSVVFKSAADIVQQVDFSQELNVCLGGLVANEELQQKLHQYVRVSSSLMDQHIALCQYIFQIHVQYASAEIMLCNELGRLTQDDKDFKMKCRRDASGRHLLGQDYSRARIISDALMSRIKTQLRLEGIGQTRKVAADKNKLLLRAWSEMEKTLVNRVLYLETRKQKADNMIERVKKSLEKRVHRGVTDRQKRVMMLKRYNVLCEIYAAMDRKYLEMYELPVQLSRAQHSIIVLKAEESVKRGVELICCRVVVLHDRINQLENELQMQTKHVKELEEASRKSLVSADKVIKRGAGVYKKLQNKKVLLYEAIDEVEQLYKSLLLECTKYKDIASLTLNKRFAQEQINREHQEKQLRELLSSAEDSAIVDELQHQLMQIKATYQQFIVQYDLLTETQQQLVSHNERLDPETEKKVQELTAVREKSRDKVQILENAICQVNGRGWTAQNSRWEVFRKRLDALEDEIHQSNQRGSEHGSSHSSLMKGERDLHEMNLAAHVMIASLTQFVEESVIFIDACQRKPAIVRTSSAQDRLETTQFNKKFTEENQRMMAQLKDVISAIKTMVGSGKSIDALQAAQARHDHVLQEWKQAEIALKSAKQSIQEFQMEHKVLQNERDLAEARAGEALEEIVLLRDNEEKLKLLCTAVIKVKEDILKPEDHHAVEIVKRIGRGEPDFMCAKAK